MVDHAFVRELIERFGSPLYLYDLDEVDRRKDELSSALPEGAELFYSFKANPLPSIAAALRRRGCRAEVSSAGELEAALAAGFTPQHILYGGPAKTSSEVRAALERGVTTFSCESDVDLARVASEAGAARRRAEVLLRINAPGLPRTSLAMSGVPSQFGYEEHDLSRSIAELGRLADRVDVCGAHVYYGTQTVDSEALAACIASAIETAERLSSLFDSPFRVVDVGGGFPWPLATDSPPPDLSGLRSSLCDIAAGRRRTAAATLWFESGRYLVASSGTLVATIMDVKTSKRGKKYVVLDAGVNHLGGMSGLGRIMRPAVSIRPVWPAETSAPREVVDVVGPLCSPLDCLMRDAQIQEPHVGDVVSIPNVGAYGLTASLVCFLSRTPPIEITCRGTRWLDAHQIRTGHEACSPPDA